MSRADDEIRWVKAQQPAVEDSDHDTTARARAVLLAHAARSRRLAPVAAAPVAGDRRRRRFGSLWRSRRVPLTAAVVAVAAVAAALALGPRVSHQGGVLASHSSGATALVTLANHVAAAQTEGDATLVVHTNDVQGEHSFTGADLYLDDGRYYYATTPAGLSAAVQAGPQDFSLKALMDAMSSGSSSDPQGARTAFLEAANPLYGGNVMSETSAQQDNVIWVASMDVLGAAYGKPDVLAGTLRALSTVDGVSVTNGSADGVQTLQISMKVPAETVDAATIRRALAAERKAQTKASAAAAAKLAYALKHQSKEARTTPAHVMQATVDAATGALLSYTDIGLTVTYHVSRVTAADYGAR